MIKIHLMSFTREIVQFKETYGQRVMKIIQMTTITC